MLALLFQLLVPYVHRPAAAASPERPWGAAGFCLPTGPLPPGYAPAPGERGPGEPAEHEPETPPCSICKTLQQTGGFIPLTAVPILYRFDRGVRVHLAGLAVAIARGAVSTSQPRAPPALV